MLATGGCSRTDDGSVVLAAQRVDLGRYDLRHLGRERSPAVPATRVAPVEVFPIMPSQSARPTRLSAGKTVRRGKSKGTPTAPADAEGISCTTMTASGKRVHVVCN
jgi:hypothetical protein